MIAWKLPEPLKRPLRWVGYPLFSLGVFILALFLTLPRDRIREHFEFLASTWLNADVRAGDFGLTLFTGPGIEASGVSVRSRPGAMAEKTSRTLVDDVTLHFGLIASLRGRTDVDFKGHLAGGTIRGAVEVNPDESALELDVRGLSLGAIPVVAEKVGVPVDGKLEIKAEVRAPKSAAPQAGGLISLVCDNCSVGDGKAKLVIPGNPMLGGEGVTVPRIKLGRVAANLVVEKGRATVKDLRVHSPDGDIEIDGYIELREPLAFSMLHLYLRFRPAESLAQREPAIGLMTSVLASYKRNDGYYGVSLTGMLTSPNALAAKEPPPGILTGAPGASASPTPRSTSLAPVPPSPRFTPPPSPPTPSPTPPPAPPPTSEPPSAAPPPPPGSTPPLQMGGATGVPPLARPSSLPHASEPTTSPPPPSPPPAASEEVPENKEGEQREGEPENIQ